jgi:calcineurin-like phosphoesterase family protein
MVQPGPVGRLPLLVALCAGLLWTGSAGAATGILAIGDFGVGGTTEPAIGAAMKRFETRHPANVLLTLGDNDYTESPTAFHRNWTASFGWLGAGGLSVAGTLGNHDVRVDGGRYEFDELHMRRGHYRRRVGNVQLFILNSNRVSDATQTAWLRTALAASRTRWKIVVFHHPAFTCGNYRSNAAIVRNWVPLFERYGVDLALSGHDHNYQRFGVRGGVRYIVHGGGGPNLYSIQHCPAGYPPRRFAQEVHGFLFIRAGRARLCVSSITQRRRLLDRICYIP